MEIFGNQHTRPFVTRNRTFRRSPFNRRPTGRALRTGGWNLSRCIEPQSELNQGRPMVNESPRKTAIGCSHRSVCAQASHTMPGMNRYFVFCMYAW